MQRPEEVDLGPAAQATCDHFDIPPDDVRHARATAGEWLSADYGPEGTWARVIGRTPGGLELLMICGPELHIVATFRPLENAS